MKKKIWELFALSILLLFNSCTQIKYTGDDRLVVSGNIKNSQNIDLSGIKVETYTYIGESGTRYGDDLISYTETDAKGYFYMIFPKPTNEDGFIVHIKNTPDTYLNKSFLNIHRNNFHDFKFDLNTVKLYKEEEISRLNITLSQVNTNTSIEHIEIEGETTSSEYLVNPVDDEVEHYYGNYSCSVIKDQDIVIIYEVKNHTTNEVTTFQETVTIGFNDTTDYTIEY